MKSKTMDIYEIAETLLGPIIPAGASHVDPQRLENLHETCHVVEKLIMDIIEVSNYRARPEYSVKKAGISAYNFLKGLKEELDMIATFRNTCEICGTNMRQSNET